MEVKVPELGESVLDAVVGSWMKAEGDSVSAGETILELETDKVNLDVTADSDGVLSKIVAQEGDVVEVGSVLCEIEAGAGAGAPAPAAEADAGKEEVTPAAEPAPKPEAEQQAAAAPATTGGGRAAPAVQRMAEQNNIDLAKVSGSGPDGRITRDDLVTYLAQNQGSGNGSLAGQQLEVQPAAAQPQAAAAKPAAAPKAPSAPAVPADPSGREERVRMSRRRQTIARRLVDAQQTAAMLTTFNEVDMTAIMDIRKRRKESFQEAHGVGLGFMSFFTKAVVGALKSFPDVNAQLDGDELVYKKYYDIGIAVGVEEGLVVPVVRDADRKGFAQIESDIKSLAGKARDGKLTLEELSGGTFTITNGGVFGSLLSTPILNTPQVGILGMHAIKERPMVVDGEIVARPMMYLAFSYDHRVIDGNTSVKFLVKIKELLEDPETLLLEG